MRSTIVRFALVGVVGSLAWTVRASDLAATLREADAAVKHQEFSTAIRLLEDTLSSAPGDAKLLDLLRRAYRGEIRELVVAGDSREAQKLLDRLKLIERGPGDAPPAPSRAPGVNDVAASRSPSATDVPNATITGVRPRRPADAEANAVTTKASPARDQLVAADALFLAGRYADADRAYREAQAANESLDRTSQERWAYCRLVAVVDAMNRQPTSQTSWNEIRAELASINELLPDNDFARSLVEIAGRAGPKSAVAATRSPAPETVIRAASPDEAAPSSKGLLATLAARIGLAGSDSSATQSLWKRFRSGNWQVLETSNFRVHYTDEKLAGPVADIAECTRIELYRTWFGRVPETDWQPKCDIYIHDTAAAYARATGQGPASPGHSASAIDRGRITSRRVDLRKDGPDILHAVLPHEITHVVMTDRFPSHPLPRWADEGLAVLTEPVEKKQAHLRNLAKPAGGLRLFTAKQMMEMSEYPPGNQWPTFYAESVSLVEYLVERGGPERLIEFLGKAAPANTEAELRRLYGIASYSVLDREWSQGRVEQIAAACGTAKR